MKIPLHNLLFLPNIPAGMDWSVIGYWAAILRKTDAPAEPIKIFPVLGTSFYRVADGRHRVIAAYIAGRREIEAEVEEEDTSIQRS